MAWNSFIDQENKMINQQIFGSPHTDCFVQIENDFDSLPVASETIYSFKDAWTNYDELIEHRCDFDASDAEDEIYPICWVSCQESGFGQMSTLETIANVTSDPTYIFGKHTLTMFNQTMSETTNPLVDESVVGMPYSNLNNLSGNEYLSSPFSNQYNYTILPVLVETNIPIVFFREQNISQSEQYILCKNYADTGNFLPIKDVITAGNAIWLNPTSNIDPEGSEFTIYNTGQRGTWKRGDILENVSSPYYRWVKLKLSKGVTDGRIAFYRAGLNNGIIKLIPKIGATVLSCEYSTDGGVSWHNSIRFPFDYIYGERINEIGTFIYATRTGLNGDKGVPIFETEAEADGWVNHDPTVDISDALNYEGIANRYKITNPTGAKEVSTTMGDGGSQLKNYFTQEYVCSYGNVSEIANAFFDVGPQGIWESIKDGIEMMGANPIDCICGLKVFNFDVSQVLSGLSSWNHIYFGGYKYDLTGGSVKKVINHGGYKDLGTFTIHDAFPNKDDFRNYEPYCKLKIYIPTVGIQELSYNKYRGKTVKLRMYLDIKSGATLMCLLADNVLYDFFNGSCGVDIPITLTDKAALGQAQLQNLSNLAGVGVNMGTAAATKDIGAGLATIANFETTLNGMNNTSADQFNVTKGGSSPMGNGYFLPTYVYLIFEYIKTAETENLNQLEGRATNRSGNLNSFSGYLQIDSINLQTTGAMSESEKSEFVSLLQSGIFI